MDKGFLRIVFVVGLLAGGNRSAIVVGLDGPEDVESPETIETPRLRFEH